MWTYFTNLLYKSDDIDLSIDDIVLIGTYTNSPDLLSDGIKV